MKVSRRPLICLFLFVAACDDTASRSEDHLRSFGHTLVTCTPDGDHTASCRTDDKTYRCLGKQGGGCSSTMVVCEQIYAEVPK